MDEWTTRLERAVLGEAQGEAYFRAMADGIDDPDQRGLIERCAELERRMRERLGDVGMHRELTDEERAEWTAYGARGAASGWDEIVRGLAELTAPAIEAFEAMRAAAPPEHLDAVSDLLLHEEALRGAGLLLQRGDHHAARTTIELAIAQISVR